MKKRHLLKVVKNYNFENSKTFCIQLLCEFLETEQVQALANHKQISFRDYLIFVQKKLLEDTENFYQTKDPIELFKSSSFTDENEATFIENFIREEEGIHVPTYKIVHKWRTDYTLKPSSVIIATHEGNVISNESYKSEKAQFCKVNYKDTNPGNDVTYVIKDPASLIVMLPKGYHPNRHPRANKFQNNCEVFFCDSYGYTINSLIYPASSITIVDYPQATKVTSISQPILIKKAQPHSYAFNSLPEKITDRLIHNAFLVCAQFHKGMQESKLPESVLLKIYSYVFPFQDWRTDIIENSYGLKKAKDENIYIENKFQVSTSSIFAKSICGMKFFDSKPLSASHRAIDAAEGSGLILLALFHGGLTTVQSFSTLLTIFPLLWPMMPIASMLTVDCAAETVFFASKAKHKIKHALGYESRDHSNRHGASVQREVDNLLGAVGLDEFTHMIQFPMM